MERQRKQQEKSEQKKISAEAKQREWTKREEKDIRNAVRLQSQLYISNF